MFHVYSSAAIGGQSGVEFVASVTGSDKPRVSIVVRPKGMQNNDLHLIMSTDEARALQRAIGEALLTHDIERAGQNTEAEL